MLLSHQKEGTIDMFSNVTYVILKLSLMLHFNEWIFLNEILLFAFVMKYFKYSCMQCLKLPWSCIFHKDASGNVNLLLQILSVRLTLQTVANRQIARPFRGWNPRHFASLTEDLLSVLCSRIFAGSLQPVVLSPPESIQGIGGVGFVIFVCMLDHTDTLIQ